eukprot:scaffold43_cov111-Skeletonema_menzelii.AAC.1
MVKMCSMIVGATLVPLTLEFLRTKKFYRRFFKSFPDHRSQIGVCPPASLTSDQENFRQHCRLRPGLRVAKAKNDDNNDPTILCK